MSLTSRCSHGVFWVAMAAGVLLTLFQCTEVSADPAGKNRPKTNNNNNNNNDVSGGDPSSEGDRTPSAPPGDGRPQGEQHDMGTASEDGVQATARDLPTDVNMPAAVPKSKSASRGMKKKESQKMKPTGMPQMVKCKMTSDCAMFNNSACEPYPMEPKQPMYCLCGDLEPPKGPNCTVQRKVVRFPCSSNDECVQDAECVLSHGDHPETMATAAAAAAEGGTTVAPRGTARPVVNICWCKGELQATEDRKQCLDGLGKLRYDMQMMMARLEADQMQLNSRVESLEGGADRAVLPSALLVSVAAAAAGAGLGPAWR